MFFIYILRRVYAYAYVCFCVRLYLKLTYIIAYIRFESSRTLVGCNM